MGRHLAWNPLCFLCISCTFKRSSEKANEISNMIGTALLEHKGSWQVASGKFHRELDREACGSLGSLGVRSKQCGSSPFLGGNDKWLHSTHRSFERSMCDRLWYGAGQVQQAVASDRDWLTMREFIFCVVGVARSPWREEQRFLRRRCDGERVGTDANMSAHLEMLNLVGIIEQEQHRA